MDEDWDEEIKMDSTSTYKPPPPATINSSSTATASNSQSYGFGRREANRYDDTSSRGNNQSFSRGNDYNTSRGGGGGDNYYASRNKSPCLNDRNLMRNNSERSRDYGESSTHGRSFSSSDYNKNEETISIEVRSISTLIGKGGATISNIREKCNVRINVPNRDELANKTFTDIKIIGTSRDNINRAKDMIRDVLQSSSNYGRERSSGFGGSGGGGGGGFGDRGGNSFNSSLKRTFDNRDGENNGSYRNDYNNNNKDKGDDQVPQERSFSKIDWNAVRNAPLQNMNKFKDHPPVVKDFYIEDDEVKAMTMEQVREFRATNFNITVEMFKKEKLSYALRKEEEKEVEKTPEEMERIIYEKIPNPVSTFEQAFRKFPEILDECRKQNFVKPSPIQSQMWPILLKGLDCVGIAQTGTGKTLAFLLPALIHIDNQITPREERLGPNVLVLSPTRELALQIEQEVKKINYKGIKSVCVYGGGDRKEQVNICTKGVQIVIATPGRLYDLIQAGIINVTSVTYLVLDEADRMLDLGFEPQIMKILLDIRPDRQTVMTSATWPEGVRRLATKYLAEPIQLYVGSLDLRAAKTVTQELVMIQSDDEKKDRLMHYIENEMSETDKLIVFVGRKAMADGLSCDLILKNIKCQCIHGDREQCDREYALEDFKEGVVRILIATDVASRGIDVKDITCVVNYDFPRNIEDYVHRVGRTGRAGSTGRSVTFMMREDWKHAKELIEILKQGDQVVPQSLVDMAERYDAMLKRRAEEGGGRGGRRGSFSGGSGGGGGFGGFGGGPRGRRGGRGGGGFF